MDYDKVFNRCVWGFNFKYWKFNIGKILKSVNYPILKRQNVLTKIWHKAKKAKYFYCVMVSIIFIAHEDNWKWSPI